MRAVLLTSTFPRHVWVASDLARRLDLVGVWQEEKTFVPQRYAVTDDDARVIAEHFAARDDAERRDFGTGAPNLAPGSVRRVVPSNACSAREEVDAMLALRPDVGLVFGTGILKGAVLEAFRGRLINIHLGLSPYYRGAGTNFWPLVNREPEYVGATIHYIDEGIDTGPMLAHVRPECRPDDGPHELGNRTIMAAAAALARAAALHASGRLAPAPQEGDGRLYQRKHFNAAAVTRMYENFRTGMIPEYLADQQARDAAIRLMELPA